MTELLIRKAKKGDKYDEAQDESDNEESDDAKFEISVVDQEVSNEHLWNCFFHGSDQRSMTIKPDTNILKYLIF